MSRLSRSSVVIALSYPLAVAALCYAVLSNDSRVGSNVAPAAAPQFADRTLPTPVAPTNISLADAR